MIRIPVFVLLAAMTALGSQQIAFPTVESDSAREITYSKDVLPILQRNCQSCHRPGQVAPMSFLTYESTRPWAKAIRAAVLSKKMPPWFADPSYGGFRNAPQLTAADIETLSAWANSGAREGKAEDKPSEPLWVEGWRTKPDVIVSIPAPYRVQAKGEGEIKEFLIPNPFRHDTWVSSIEVRPGEPSVVHHVIVQFPEQTASTGHGWGLQPALAASQERVLRRPSDRTAGNNGSYGGESSNGVAGGTAIGAFTTMEAVYAPGSQPLDFQYHNSAKLIRAGTQLRIEVHYTPNGKETMDRTMVGFTLAKGPAKRRFVMMAPSSLVNSAKSIPAGEPNFETRGELTFTQDAELVWFMPHMHLRGKDMTFRLIYPNGREDTVLRANFNFQWQLGYEVEEPIKVPRGTKMMVTAHYDNSANNPSNPNPKKDVVWGELTSEEMMLPWFGVVVNQDVDPEMIATYRPGGFAGDSRFQSQSAPVGGLPLPTPPFVPNGGQREVQKPAIFRGLGGQRQDRK